MELGTFNFIVRSDGTGFSDGRSEAARKEDSATYLFSSSSPKLHEIERNLTERDGMRPLESANGLGT